MPKIVYKPGAGGVDPNIVLPVAKGGTGGTTAEEARTNLGALAEADLGTQFAQLGPDNKIPVGQLPSMGNQQVTLSGPKIVTAGQSASYRITNYSAFRTYTIAVKAGTGAVSVSRVGDTITLTTSTGKTTAVFYVNGREITVSLT